MESVGFFGVQLTASPAMSRTMKSGRKYLNITKIFLRLLALHYQKWSALKSLEKVLNR